MCKLLQGIAGLPGPIGVDGGPGLPGQKGEKVILNYSFFAYKDPKCIITKNTLLFVIFIFSCRVRRELAYKVFKVLMERKERRYLTADMKDTEFSHQLDFGE